MKRPTRVIAIAALGVSLMCPTLAMAKKPPPGPTPAELNPAIAYVQQSKRGVDVVVAAADLGSQVVLTETVRETYRQFGSPAWSPDGQFVAFWVSDKDADGNQLVPKLFVARADSSQVTLVRDFATRPGHAPSNCGDGLNWSPSGKELVYRGMYTRLVAIDAANGDTRVLCQPSGLQPALSPDLDPDEPGYQGLLAVTDLWDIFIVAIEDDDDGYLLPVPTYPDSFINVTNKPDSRQFHPSWSPDGTKLACFDDGSLAVIDWMTGEWQTLAPNYRTGVSGAQDRATWASDGSALVFRSWDIPLYDLAIIAADGSTPVVNYTATRNLTEMAPAWNPQWDPAGPGGF